MRVTCWNVDHPCDLHRYRPDCTEWERAHRIWPTIVGAIIIGLFVGWWLNPARAYAEDFDPSACPGASASSTVEGCRDHEWTMRPDFTVGPRQVVRSGDLPSCEQEDSGRMCSWNWTGHHDGNGYGASFWRDRHTELHYVWPSDPRGGGWRWMTKAEDSTHDAALHPNRWQRCVILETEDSTSIRCADGEHHRTSQP